MIICIDITEMLNVEYITGIQRVVKEIAVRWIEERMELKLLSYDLKNKCFIEADNHKFYNYYTGKNKNKKILTHRKMRIDDFNSQHLFFDIDAVWMTPLKRSYLLPLLKSRGTGIAVFIHDIIPLTEPFYCHETTVFWFLEYLGAHLTQADFVITSTQATISVIETLLADILPDRLHAQVVRLGSGFMKKEITSDKLPVIRKHIMQVADGRKYVLMVGTLEPRKNHQFVLKAFEKSLFEDGISLVLAGRTGWNIDTFVAYVRSHEQLGRKLYFIEDASDEEIAFLYKNALLVAFSSYNEGFGLPIIEALESGTIVLASDIPVLREAGGEYCTYFSLDDSSGFAELVREYSTDQKKWNDAKEKLKQYQSCSWEDCARNMQKALYNNVNVKQEGWRTK